MMTSGRWSIAAVNLAHKMSTNIVMAIISLSLLGSAASGMLDITAFEYIRKFSAPLNLGDCPRREVSIPTGKRSQDVERQACSLKKRGNVTSLTRVLNDTRNVPISSASDIIAYFGLCGGEAASFLGLLYKGDCVAIQIASRLTFSDKTMVRAFVEYYRKSIDILDNTWLQREQFDHYYDGKYYLKNLSYGTLELIIVQFRFQSRKDAEKAKEIKTSTDLMSKYMETVKNEIGTPSNIMVIRLSTAESKEYQLKKFKKGEFNKALRHVKIEESEIRYLRERITSNRITPHLTYVLYPFKQQSSSNYRIGTSSVNWEKTSMLEVSLRQAVSVGRKASRRCRRNRSKLCNRTRELLRTLKKTQRKIHKSRTRWMDLSSSDKHNIVLTYEPRVNSYSNVMKRLARAVRKWRKIEKLNRQKQKSKINNQTGIKGIKGHRRIKYKKSRRS